MKKLIALMFCVAVLATAARAEYPQQEKKKKADMRQAVDQQVDKAQRVVALQVNTGNLPAEYANGKAVIIGTQKGKLVLLTSQSLATDIDALGDEVVFATFTQNKKKTHGMIANIKADNPAMNQHFYVITLQVKNGVSKQIPMLPLQEARKLL